MTRFAESYAVWLADYYLLATILLALALAAAALLRQPAHRLAVTKSTLIALMLLAALCALPGWSVVHLLAAERPPSPVQSTRHDPFAASDVLAERPHVGQGNSIRPAEQPALARPTAGNVLTTSNEPKTSWTALLTSAHLAGIGCIIVWLALGWIASVRLRRTAQAAPANVCAILDELVSLNSRKSKRPRLFTHDRIEVAVALGVWRPMILLPKRWTNSQSHDRLRTILTHESTHILNHDLQWVALARILFIPLWANPLFWLVKRRLRLDQEALADAAAAELTSRQRYAAQLVAWAREARNRPANQLSSAVGLWEGPSQLRQRLAILLDERFTVLRNCSRRWRVVAGVLAIVSTTALSMVTIQPGRLAPPIDSKHERATGLTSQPTPANDGHQNKPVHFPIVVAKHVMLDGKKIITWEELEGKIAALRDPSLAYPQLYVTKGARETQMLAAAKARLKLLDQKFKFKEQAEHSLAPRADLRYDRIKNESDLTPDRALQVAGVVQATGGAPAAGAEVVLCLPVDDSVRNKTLDIYLREFRLRNRQEEIVTETDAAGRFAVYPPHGTPYYLVALHRDGFGLVRSDSFEKSRRIEIHPWARIEGRDATDALFESGAAMTVHVLATGRWPELSFDQFTSDIDQPTPDGRFDFAFVPPSLAGELTRNIAHKNDVFQLRPGEVLKVAGPKNEALQSALPESKREQPKSSASHAETSSQGEAEPPLELAASRSADENGNAAGVYLASESKPGNPNTLDGQCVDENGKTLANVEVVLNRVWWQDAARREAVAKQTTQADGKFRFDNVVDIAKIYPGGKIPKLPDFAAPYFQVAARKSGRVSVAEVVAQNDIARQGSRQTFKMLPAATLRGRITNPKGEPVAGALVSVGFSQLDRWEGFQTVRSGPDGRFEINDAPPFDSKNVEKTQTWRVGKQDELVFPRVIFVEHPNYASGAVYCKKIPGTQDLQLKAAAIITGRVMDGTTKQPAANAAVQAFPSRQTNTLWDVGTGYAVVRTDGRGEYRITSLPEGAYDLCAVAPNRVNEGVKKLKTSAEHVTTAPDLVMSGGGTIRVRLIDEKTGKPIPLKGDERAEINVTPSPPMTAPAMVEAKNGRFEVHALPGEDRVDNVTASSNDAIKWIIRTASPVTVRVVEGKSTDADVRVQDIANLERFNRISALLSRALEERLADEHKAIADLEQAIKLDPPYPLNVGAYSCLALILATSADYSVRDGKRAVELAQKAQKFEDKPSAFVLEALAAAYAEIGDFDRAVASEKEAIEHAKKEQRGNPSTDYLKLYEAHKPRREVYKSKSPAKEKNQGASNNSSDAALVGADFGKVPHGAQIQLVQNTTPVAEKTEVKRPPEILGYGDDKPDGKKSYGGSGEMIRFELPKGVTKIKGIRIHGSRYGLPQAPKEDFEITFLNEKRDETLHVEAAPYRLFNRGKEQWVRVAFKNEVELPRKFWVCLNFNAAQTKGVYVSYDTSTKGAHSRMGLAGDKEEPKETDFKGDWMVQLLLAKPAK